MRKIKKIPTCDIPDGYYAQHWSKEGEILRDKINEILEALEEQDKGVTIVVNSNNDYLEEECRRWRDECLNYAQSALETQDRINEVIDLIKSYTFDNGETLVLYKIKNILQGRNK